MSPGGAFARRTKHGLVKQIKGIVIPNKHRLRNLNFSSPLFFGYIWQ